MQKEIVAPIQLLNEKGHLNQAGYAKKMIIEYHRDQIKANKFRIKEWDYYIVMAEEHAIALTVADNSYMGLLSVSFLDFKNKRYKTSSIMKFFTMGKLGLPNTSKSGDIVYSDKKISISITNDGLKRVLRCNMPNFDNNKSFICDITLTDEPAESMVIATPFKENKKAFYFNQKINTMKAKGKAIIGDQTYLFDDKSFGTLDWGRGVWTYKNTWYWGSCSGIVNDKRFGFNIGYGFGDTSNATENMVIYDGKAHKLTDISFNIPKINGKEEYLEEWTFTSSDKRFNMTFTPILDRYDNTNLLLLASNQHQVFGYFSGTFVLDNEEIITLDKHLGFAEKVMNKW